MDGESIITVMGDLRTAISKHLAKRELTPEVITDVRVVAERCADQLLANEPYLRDRFDPEKLKAMFQRLVDDVLLRLRQAA